MSLETLVRTVLYEGYALYPYRPSALKNQRRLPFGAIVPRAWAERTLEADRLRIEVVAREIETPVDVSVRFLVLGRGGGATEHAAGIGRYVAGELQLETAATTTRDGDFVRYAVEVQNVSDLRDVEREAAMDLTAASTQIVLKGPRFVSAIDPPAGAESAVAACRSSGLYAALVAPDAILASPMILPDFPEIAPESSTAYFDGTEIDEMLRLRVLTMTDAEKVEAARDPRVAAILDTGWPREGSRVRIHPRPGADAFDTLLANRTAVVVKVERDLDGRVHCAVALDDDPGADLALAGYPGHRFYFAPAELEVLP